MRFTHRARHFFERAPQDGLRVQKAPVLPADQHQQRRARNTCSVKTTHAVAESGRHVQIDNAERARGARVTIGHRHGGNLGERDDVLELAAAFAQAHQRNFGGAGIAEDMADAVRFQRLQQQFSDFQRVLTQDERIRHFFCRRNPHALRLQVFVDHVLAVFAAEAAASTY